MAQFERLLEWDLIGRSFCLKLEYLPPLALHKDCCPTGYFPDFDGDNVDGVCLSGQGQLVGYGTNFQPRSCCGNLVPRNPPKWKDGTFLVTTLTGH